MKESARLVPRKLKTYQTSIGFFELAIAAPSMKAALEAWGSNSNRFHQGFAKESQDPAIIAAAMARPGVVLRRAVGSNDTFRQNAELPRDLGDKQPTAKRQRSAKEPQVRKLDDKAIAEAARAFEREKVHREQQHAKEAAAQERRRKQRERAIDKAQTAIAEATRIHESKIAEIASARSALDKKMQAEDARWLKRRTTLEAALVRARDRH